MPETKTICEDCKKSTSKLHTGQWYTRKDGTHSGVTEDDIKACERIKTIKEIKCNK